MYIYSHTEVEHLTPFAWFVAEGRSMYEVVLLVQKGFIKDEFIKTVKNGNRIYVAFTNFDNWELKSGVKYHIHPILTETKGYIRVGIALDFGEYVASWFRPELNEEILTSTWKKIFDNESAPIPCPTEDEEYADYEEPNIYEETINEFNSSSYDLEYDYDSLLCDELFDDEDFIDPIESTDPTENIEEIETKTDKK